jgi:lipopolysaccharide/colanic/teichoic acid biosynthesis glycosyltransferase
MISKCTVNERITKASEYNPGLTWYTVIIFTNNCLDVLTIFHLSRTYIKFEHLMHNMNIVSDTVAYLIGSI